MGQSLIKVLMAVFDYVLLFCGFWVFLVVFDSVLLFCGVLVSCFGVLEWWSGMVSKQRSSVCEIKTRTPGYGKFGLP